MASSAAGVAPLGDVGDREERRHASRTKRPPSSTRVSPTSSVASRTTQSRWIGTETVPPIPALAPNAMWIEPRIFSSSRTLPLSEAAGVGADAQLGEVGAAVVGAQARVAGHRPSSWPAAPASAPSRR